MDNTILNTIVCSTQPCQLLQPVSTTLPLGNRNALVQETYRSIFPHRCTVGNEVCNERIVIIIVSSVPPQAAGPLSPTKKCALQLTMARAAASVKI